MASPFFRSVMRKNLSTNAFDQLALSISKPDLAAPAPVIVSVWFVDAPGNTTTPPQNLTGLDTAANVLYGVGPGVTGASALYTIAPFNPGLQIIP